MTELDRDGGGEGGGGGTRDEAAPLDRISTGNAEADDVLHGGFPTNSINVVMGQPGTGKTIFAEQLVFHNAGGDRPILYFSTLAEPIGKLVRYLQGFRFFDAEKLGTAVIYEDIGEELVAEGARALLGRLKSAILTVSPKIIVVDSFRAVHELGSTTTPMRELVYEIAGMLTAYETTTFLLGEYDEEEIERYPEFAIADAVVQFSRRPLGTRDERFFRVFKLRGSAYAEGAHAVNISDSGIHVYPRLVTPKTPEPYEMVMTRVPTGVPGLDEMVGGGFWTGSTTLVAGPSGSGKTSIGLQFARAGTKRGESTLYVNFQENPTQLARSIRGLGIDLEEAQAAGLRIMYTSPVELQIDSIIVEVFRRVRDDRVERIVIDAIGDLAMSASDQQRLHDYLYSLIQHLVTRNVTSILTYETVGHRLAAAAPSQGAISYMSDNLIHLTLEGEERTRRMLRVVKTRASENDLRVRELIIDGRGVRII